PLTEIVAAVSHPATETDFTNNAKALVAAKPQVIAAFTTPAAAAGLLRALKAEGYTGLFVYGAITNPDFLSQLSPAEAVGVIGAGGWSPSAQDQASRRFVEAYQRTFGELPDSHAAAYYDGVYMLIDALRRGNSAAPATLQSNLSRLTRFAGAAGEYRPAVFGRGQLGQTVFMYEVTADGALREISRWEGVNCINSCN
ncbi:MAG: ABC transporter substrate-binding protein, partial [Anaerolinea sp.]|nr:ABC transporter substrate-binding protein [Anaerolinea sp.]